MGWLGWTQQESLETDVNCIMIAMEGKLEMMYPEIKNTSDKVINTKFKDFVKSHNARFKAEKNKKVQ